MTDFTQLISQAVAEKMTPDFIEKQVNTRVEKLVIESIDQALRTYSDTGKQIQKAVEESLRVNRLDLPSYGDTVLKILHAQIEAQVSELVAGRLSQDMEDMLSLAPKEIKLSEIANQMRKRYEEEGGYGEVITVIVGDTSYSSTWVYLDETEHLSDRDKHKAQISMLVREDGTLAAVNIHGHDIKKTKSLGFGYGLEQLVRSYYAVGTKIELDENNVVVSVGDY